MEVHEAPARVNAAAAMSDPAEVGRRIRRRIAAYDSERRLRAELIRRLERYAAGLKQENARAGAIVGLLRRHAHWCERDAQRQLRRSPWA
jgi:hypothetical protein